MSEVYTLSSIQDLTQSVDGFLSQNGKNLFEGEVLYYLAKKSKGIVVEIGSWKGKSTIWIGKGSEAGLQNPVYAIDMHTGSPEHQKDGEPVWTFDVFKQNIAQANLNPIIKPLVLSSVDGAKEITQPVDFIFIDGAHDYDSCKQDFETWFPKLAQNGTIAFHDSFMGWTGVEKVVRERLHKSKQFKKIRYINSITYAIKVEQTSLKDRLENRLILLLKQVHKNSLRLPQPFRSMIKRLIWHPFQRKWRKELELH